MLLLAGVFVLLVAVDFLFRRGFAAGRVSKNEKKSSLLFYLYYRMKKKE